MGISTRLSTRLTCTALLLALSGPASAALRKYDLTIRTISNSGSGQTPNPNINRGGPGERDFSSALIDGAAPVLRKFNRAIDATTTTLVPSLTSSIFTSNNFREGPGVLGQVHGGPVPSFTGTGSVANGANIRWGTLTGWTITGNFWCNSSPAVICSLAMGTDEGTTDPRFNSDFYDIGTWYFHGTGFTASMDWIYSYFPTNFGNQQLWVRGFESQDGTVPALPLVGGLLLGGGLMAGGITALRWRRRN